MADTICLFGGTTEGRILAQKAWKMWDCHVFVATDEGRAFLAPEQQESGRVHVGRLDEEQMIAMIRNLRPAFVLDSTHPYAVEVSRNLQNACHRTEVRYIRVLRERAEPEGCRLAADAGDAARILAEEYTGCPVLLTTGSKELSAFSGLCAVNREIYARILPGEANLLAARRAGIRPEHILTGVGPFSEEENLEVLKRYAIRVLVTKESGVRGGFYEKLHAAEKTGAAVLVIRRPEEDAGISMDAALRLLDSRF